MELICWEAQYLRDVFLENNAKFKLPPTARNVQVATKNGSSWCSIAVSFEMASSELAVFEDGIQVGKLSSTTPIKWGLQPHEELVSKLGFNLTANLLYLFAYTDDDYFDQQFVFVGTKDVETYIVYLVTEVGFLD